jgi:acyl-CoA oxidase
MLANVQAILLMCFRISELADQEKASLGQIAMAKAFVTERGREVVKWGREVFGGNGIIHENYAMKAMMDMEAIYTYEGTYEINTLVAGRDITGIAAFKGGSGKN